MTNFKQGILPWKALLLTLLVLKFKSKSATATRRGLVSTTKITASFQSGLIDATSTSETWPGDSDCISSYPNLCKFVDELPIPEEIDISTGEVLTLGAYNIQQKVHRDIPPTPMYGFGASHKTASTPGPTLLATRRIVSKVRWENHLVDETFTLPNQFIGLATNGTVPMSIHVHGGETEPQSDGHPDGWFTSAGDKGEKFVSQIHTYHNGQPAATVWYHDHTISLTGHNVYNGLVGFYIVSDPEEQEFELPAKEFDIPLVFQYKVVAENGTLQETNDDPHQDGGVLMVNGKAWPFYNVERTTYRFRLLDGANLYIFNVSFIVANQTTKNASAVGLDFSIPDGYKLDFHQIASDGGFLRSPAKMNQIPVGPAERAEILVDFSSIPERGPQEVYLISTGGVPTVGADGELAMEYSDVVLAKFIIPADARSIPSPPLPAVMNCNIPTPSTARAVRTRWITLTQMTAEIDVIHLLGMHLYTDEPTEVVKEGTTEVWALVNLTPQAHTIHIHATKFQLVSRQKFSMDAYSAGNCSFLEPEAKGSCYTEPARSPIAGSEQGWKDTMFVNDYEVTLITFSLLSEDGVKFPFDPTAFPGYVWHCHLLEHEDYVMMRPFVVERSKTDEVYDQILVNNDYPDLSLVVSGN